MSVGTQSSSAWWHWAAAAGQEPGSQQVLVGHPQERSCWQMSTPAHQCPSGTPKPPSKSILASQGMIQCCLTRNKKKYITPAEILVLSFYFHFPRCKLSHRWTDKEAIWHLCQMDLLAIGDPSGVRSDCDVWSLQLQGQGTGEAVWPAAGGAPSLWNHCSPLPRGNICAQPLPQEHPLAAQLHEALWDINIFLLGFIGRKDKPKTFPQLLNLLFSGSRDTWRLTSQSTILWYYPLAASKHFPP